MTLDEQFQRKHALLKQYLRKHGWNEFTLKTTYRGVRLGSWINDKRHRHKEGLLSRDHIKKLEALPGWSWAPVLDLHKQKAKLLRQYIKRNGWKEFAVGHTVYKGHNLGTWVMRTRYRYKTRELSEVVIELLEGIPGWTWASHRAVKDYL